MSGAAPVSAAPDDDKLFLTHSLLSVDLLFCDFGVGGRMKEFMEANFGSVRPGGYVVVHSTLTNRNTRAWVEMVRRGAGKEETGIPKGEVRERGGAKRRCCTRSKATKTATGARNEATKTAMSASSEATKRCEFRVFSARSGEERSDGAA